MSIEMNIGDDTAQSSSGGNEGGVPSGVQKRFDELTATIHSLKENNVQLQQQMLETQRQAVMMIQQQPQQQTVNPLDAKLAALPEELRQPVLDTIQTAFQQFSMPLKMQQAEMQFASLAAQYGLNEQEAKAAQNLLSNWQQRGIPGVNPEDAISATIGIVNLPTRRQMAARQGQSVQMMSAGGQQLPQQPQAAPTQEPYPDDFDDWSVDKQWTYLAKRTGNMK